MAFDFSSGKKPLKVFGMAGLADIVLLLLIFFLLTSNFIPQFGIQVNLPQADAAAPNEPNHVSVAITAEGQYYVDGNQVARFAEKPRGDGGYINGGFFVLSPEVLDLIEGDETTWEASPLEQLAAMGELSAFRHDGFWLPMDTLRDKLVLDDLWKSGEAPWKVWP